MQCRLGPWCVIDAAPFVTDVAVDFDPGTVNVTSNTELDPDAIESVMNEASHQYVN